jgi:exodeoxyribonuclease VII small subunit
MSEISLEILTFEQALAELERIVRELENGQIGLEESLASYEKGIGLLKRCYGQLQQAEQRIVLLKGLDADDQPVTQAFEAALSQPEANDHHGRLPPQPSLSSREESGRGEGQKKTNNANDLF